MLLERKDERCQVQLLGMKKVSDRGKGRIKQYLRKTCKNVMKVSKIQA